MPSYPSPPSPKNKRKPLMEHGSPLLAELNQAMELARQLQSHLDHPCKALALEIVSSIEKSILFAQSGGLGGDIGASPPSAAEMMKRRKMSQVRVSSIGEEDGYSWRKYGQKDILGANHPRAYYRCTHRHTRGCPATKQVQRSDDDPAVFEVTYHGAHTCLERQQASPQQQQQSLSSEVGLKGHEESMVDILFPELTLQSMSPPRYGFDGEVSLQMADSDMDFMVEEFDFEQGFQFSAFSLFS
ncbi:putative WRKY transcription factor 53 [Canna indica]|uniref:WRKY transcription factor 53 n=1 Tax=Canna indica TaxID=4628 RepID=A0AAQ3JZQ8_9LILI|nr:putative WRKY transcription factor 53 [Canna indica]